MMMNVRKRLTSTRLVSSSTQYSSEDLANESVWKSSAAISCITVPIFRCFHNDTVQPEPHLGRSNILAKRRHEAPLEDIPMKTDPADSSDSSGILPKDFSGENSIKSALRKRPIRSCEPTISTSKESKVSKKRTIDVIEAAKYFFSYDWYSEANLQYDPKSNFTPAVYWHYIETQYFTVPNLTESVFSKMRASLAKHVGPAEFGTTELNYLALAAILRGNLLESPQYAEEKKELTVEQIINEVETHLEQCKAENMNIEQKINKRIKAAYDEKIAPDQADFQLSSSKISEYPEDICWKYTKRELERYKIKENVEMEYLVSVEQKGKAQQRVEDKTHRKGKRKHCSSLKIFTQKQKESEDILCEICNYDDSEEPLVCCETCGLTVHRKCYGIKEENIAQWICLVCQTFSADNSKSVTCALCTVAGGALKPSTDLFGNKLNTPIYEKTVWVHLSCAYWLPELNVSYPGTVGVDLTKINKIRYKLLCTICKVRGKCCVQCSKGKCQASFHVECARLAGLCMEKVEDQGRVVRVIYCEKHRPQEIRKVIEQAQKDDAEEIGNFARITMKCLKNEKYKEMGRKMRVRDKKRVFTKGERKTLIKRIRETCKKLSNIDITLLREKNKKRHGKPQYTLLNEPRAVTYKELLSKKDLWEAIKFGRFTAEECYDKFIQLVPDSETFKKNIFSAKLSSIIKGHEVRHERMYTPNTKYCYCQKAEYETPGAQMIECSGGGDCPGNNWYHYDCIGLHLSPEELEDYKFYCNACKKILISKAKKAHY